MPQVLAGIKSPPDPVDPLFIDPITLLEIEKELKGCPPDKSPGPDGITNRMMKAGGPIFCQCLLIGLDTMWHKDRQPQIWQKSLIRPIFKGGDKDALDPASGPIVVST